MSINAANLLRNVSTLFGVVMLFVIGGAPAHAVQGSKFAAHVSQAGENMHLLHSGVADTSDAAGSVNEKDCEAGDTFFDLEEAGGVCVKADDTDAILSITISAANKKDLLVGVSLQNGLYTNTSVKGKNGSSERAGAEAGILVWVEVSGYDSDGNEAKAYPEQVVFNHRVQELNATLGGVIESCAVSVDENTLDGTIVIADDCVVTDEEIGLILSTTSANHFNFVVPDLSSGDHTVTVMAKALASAAFLNGTYIVSNLDQATCEGDGGTWDAGTEVCTFETTDNHARAYAVVDVGTLTVEQVRAINQVGGIVIDTDAGSCYDVNGDPCAN